MVKKISGILKESYTKKFLIFSLAVCFAVLFANAAANSLLEKSFFKQTSENSIKNLSAEYSEKINCKINSKLDILNFLANSEKTAKYLTASVKDKSGAYADGFDEIKSILHDCAKDSSISLAWIACDLQSFYITSDGEISGKDYNIKSSPWYSYFISKPESSVWFSGLSKSLVSDETGVTIVKSIFENGNLLGYAGIEISTKNLRTMLEEIETSQSCYPILIDSNGNKLYASENLSFISDFPPNGRNVKNAIDTALQSETGFYPLKGGKYIYFAKNPLMDIKTIIFFDNEDGLNSSKLIFSRHIFLLICSAIVSAVLILLIFAEHFKDFPKIMHSVRKYDIRDYSARVNSASNDGMGQIASCLDTLGEKIQKQSKEITSLTYLDSLTGLPNRTKLDLHLEEAIKFASSTLSKFAVIFISIDNFKWINDTLGHAAGDEFLKRFAERLSSACSVHNFTCRFNSDEFIVIHSFKENLEEVDSFIEKIKNAFLTPLEVSGQKLYVKFGIGISLYPDDGDLPEILLRNADIAVNIAKQFDLSGVEYYNSSYQKSIENKAVISQKLMAAMDNDEFYLNYQPIISTDSKEIYGFEVLLRWTNDELGTIPPSEFIPIAEETGLIIPLGKWVFETACRFYKKLKKKLGRDVIMSINISPHQLLQPDYVKSIKQVLEITQIPPEYIQLELTESVLISLFESASGILMELSELGITIALDDFGTGYNSLNYLKHFPINCLKIDKTFIDQINTSKKDFTIAGSIIDLVHNLDIKTVAEGVETENQFASLSSMKCDLIQGYLMSKPLNETQIIEFINDYKYTFRQ